MISRTDPMIEHELNSVATQAAIVALIIVLFFIVLIL